ncbi:hypothetical protein BP6252_09675 [Coleophoma cylindrospora]|uniref:Uncharacterized protein n=1 Tax=Coleophoma cylindrospora TaxID=1849047 RepID=A0A3D8QWH2_9HELO|nr:hypothetical protein BP6252_09675 [Coleophoma cylindrospora]
MPPSHQHDTNKKKSNQARRLGKGGQDGEPGRPASSEHEHQIVSMGGKRGGGGGQHQVLAWLRSRSLAPSSLRRARANQPQIPPQLRAMAAAVSTPITNAALLVTQHAPAPDGSARCTPLTRSSVIASRSSSRTGQMRMRRDLPICMGDLDGPNQHRRRRGTTHPESWPETSRERPRTNDAQSLPIPAAGIRQKSRVRGGKQAASGQWGGWRVEGGAAAQSLRST